MTVKYLHDYNNNLELKFLYKNIVGYLKINLFVKYTKMGAFNSV